MSDSCNVRVFCRFRPFNQREKDLGEDQGVEINIKPGQVEIVDPTTGRKRDFPMDHCFEGGCHQRDVFDTIALQSVEDIFEGFNGTIFAYGQTGSGKSWSMMGGDKRDADLKGIIPRSADAIFAKAAADQSGTVYSVACSYLQVYKEKIGDLLDPSKNNLQVREDPRSGVYVDGLTQAYVSSMDEVMGVLLKGDSSRAVAATNMNAVSSRSHSVFIVEVTQKTTEGGTKKGRLNLVDLAGSEKVGKTGASGNTLEEAKKINQSLSALGNVIKSLADGRGHVPYRDSKLTRILQEALGGNSKTSLLVAASPHLDNIEETLSTLRFAQRAKTIKNRVTVNEEKSVSELMAIIDQLKKQNEGLTTYVFSLETALKEAGIDPDTIRTVAAPDAFTSSGGGGGGTDAAPATMKTLELQAQVCMRGAVFHSLSPPAYGDSPQQQQGGGGGHGFTYLWLTVAVRVACRSTS
jgi:kinesin family protein 5